MLPGLMQKEARPMSLDLIRTRGDRAMWLSAGIVAVVSVFSVAFGSVPRRIKSDPAIYQELSEINVKKELAIDFDRDLSKLSKIEKRFRAQEEKELVALKDHPRLKDVIARIEKRRK